MCGPHLNLSLLQFKCQFPKCFGIIQLEVTLFFTPVCDEVAGSGPLSLHNSASRAEFLSLVQLPSRVRLFATLWTCSMLDFPVLHYLQEFAQIHVL